MLVRLSAWMSLVLGVFGAITALYPLGVGVGGVSAGLAILFGWAALSEHPAARTRRVAVLGVAAGSVAIALVLVWVTLAILGV